MEFVADALAAALLHDYAAMHDMAQGRAWTGRSAIHQATGMVVAQLGVGLGDALAILRAHAFTLDRPLDDVAHAVLVRDIVFGTDGTDGT